MLRHGNISSDDEFVFFANLFEDLEEAVASRSVNE